MTEREPHRFRMQGPRSPRFERALPGMYELSVEHSRELDRRAVEEYGMDSIVLMENAAIGLWKHAMQMLDGVPDPRAMICCGPGNNGGDGFAVARHLHNSRIPVRIVCAQHADSYTGDAAKNLRIIQRMGIETLQLQDLLNQPANDAPPLLLDALFGTGLSRPIEGEASELISWINRARVRSGSRVLAVDTPSGLDAQTGRPLNHSVTKADRTATFAGIKPGMSRVEALEYLGDVHGVPIGVPIELLEALGTLIEPRSRE
ncbi:MAG: NAD(P)H-hydrate epimerase [Phycisphaerales bacterium]